MVLQGELPVWGIKQKSRGRGTNRTCPMSPINMPQPGPITACMLVRL